MFCKNVSDYFIWKISKTLTKAWWSRFQESTLESPHLKHMGRNEPVTCLQNALNIKQPVFPIILVGLGFLWIHNIILFTFKPENIGSFLSDVAVFSNQLFSLCLKPRTRFSKMTCRLKRVDRRMTNMIEDLDSQMC